MAEEEAGFTFVDKRRTAAEAAAEEISAPEPSPPDASTDDTADSSTPDVYGVIGYCVSVLATEAWHKLGLIADPNTGEAIADLTQAKVAIDAVGDLAARLEAAPTDAVPESLRRDLRTLINDLRLNYVAQRGDNATSRN